jgi:alanyl-tRNA synthetase
MENFKNYSEQLNIAKTKFVGHNTFEANCKILALFNNKNELVNSLRGAGFIIFDQTPFYAMGGGQDSDKGTLIFNESTLKLQDVRKDLIYGYHIHQVDTKDQLLKTGDTLLLKVDREFRNRSSANHSAMHIT